MEKTTIIKILVVVLVIILLIFAANAILNSCGGEHSEGIQSLGTLQFSPNNNNYVQLNNIEVL
ncbi:MAG: hypothetical protein LBO69_05980 [Ignavibacteria bacterium]|jgi:hypothetical protein|nr:hypothetical protein [Ignavibacteria bacterium]